MKKNIFYFSPYFPPENNAASVRNFWFVKVLKNDGHKVHLVTNDMLYFKLPLNTDSAFKRLIKEALSGINLFFKVLFSKKEIYIFSSPPFITIMIGVFACWLKRSKYILDIRDIYPQVFFSLGIISEDSLPSKISLWITKKMYDKAFSIITVTNGIKKIIENETKTKIALIYNGYDPELFKPSIEKFDKFTVVFHGNLGKFQRIDLLVEVAKEMEKTHPEIQFKVIGKGPGEKYLQAPPSNLEYLGAINYQEIGKYISKCHLGISLRTDDQISRDAFPVKVFEYIGVGIPVIVSPEGEASNFVKKEEFGFETENIKENVCHLIIKAQSTEFSQKSNEEFSRYNQAVRITSLDL